MRRNNTDNLGGRPEEIITESLVKYAMESTWSNSEAAKFLRVSYTTWKKYSSMYIDSDTGKSLFELHNKSGVKRPKAKRKSYTCNSGYKERLEDILEGKYPGYPTKKLRKRLFLSGWVPLKCSSCGWDEVRLSDENFPGLLDFVDGNWRNNKLENLRIMCYNCYFCQVRTPASSWQGWTYGVRKGKARWDGRPKGYGSRKYKEERGLDVNVKYIHKRRKEIAEWYESIIDEGLIKREDIPLDRYTVDVVDRSIYPDVSEFLE